MFLGYLNHQAKGFPSPMHFLPPKHTQQKRPPKAVFFVLICRSSPKLFYVEKAEMDAGKGDVQPNSFRRPLSLIRRFQLCCSI